MNCLGHAPDDDMAEQRLRRKLNRQFGKGESISDLTVWWYNTELHLLDTLSKQLMSFQDIFFVAIVSRCTKGTTSKSLEVSTVNAMILTWKSLWPLINSSAFHDLSQSET